MGQTELTVSFLSEAVRVLTSGSRERSVVLGGDAEGGSGASDNKGLEAVVRELQTALAEEMALSVAAIRQEEEKAAAAAAGAAVNVSPAGAQVAHDGRTCVLYSVMTLRGQTTPACLPQRTCCVMTECCSALGEFGFCFAAVVLFVVVCRKIQRNDRSHPTPYGWPLERALHHHSITQTAAKRHLLLSYCSMKHDTGCSRPTIPWITSGKAHKLS